MRSEDGLTAVEYAAMAAMIILVAIGANSMFGKSVSSSFKASAESFGSLSYANSGGGVLRFALNFLPIFANSMATQKVVIKSG